MGASVKSFKTANHTRQSCDISAEPIQLISGEPESELLFRPPLATFIWILKPKHDFMTGFHDWLCEQNMKHMIATATPYSGEAYYLT